MNLRTPFSTRCVATDQRGASLLEILIVIAILALLVTLTISGLNWFKKRAQDITCMGNLRSLHTALAAYLNEHEQIWPQDPTMLKEEQEDDDGSASNKFWFETLTSYGPNRSTWLCPADRQGTAKDTDTQVYDSSYNVTTFDGERGTAYKWMNMPWLVERGGMHGKGEVNQVMPDGSIRKQAGAP